ncbi:transposase family protein [Azospirillum sp. A1-3]|uniref:transposase family protein n=1 Tax=Azospirillum sp. A1-3 TaxID=185874 RepID=UPI00336BE293
MFCGWPLSRPAMAYPTRRPSYEPALGRRFTIAAPHACASLILPWFGGSCALCVDGLGCGSEQSGYCPHGRNMQTFSFLPGCRVLQIERGSRGSLVILAECRRGSARCPHCGAVSRVVHSRYRRSPADLPAFGHEIRVALLVRRFYCRGRVPRGGVGAVGNQPAAAPSDGSRRRTGYPQRGGHRGSSIESGHHTSTRPKGDHDDRRDDGASRDA